MAFAPSLSPYRAVSEHLSFWTATAAGNHWTGEMTLASPLPYLLWSHREWEGMYGVVG